MEFWASATVTSEAVTGSVVAERSWAAHGEASRPVKKKTALGPARTETSLATCLLFQK